jgi:large-conductance mechanosensitive channel
MILIRFALVSLIIFLIVRSFLRLGEETKRAEDSIHGPKNDKKPDNKKVSKKIGEYIDYEELKK